MRHGGKIVKIFTIFLKLISNHISEKIIFAN